MALVRVNAFNNRSAIPSQHGDPASRPPTNVFSIHDGLACQIWQFYITRYARTYGRESKIKAWNVFSVTRMLKIKLLLACPIWCRLWTFYPDPSTAFYCATQICIARILAKATWLGGWLSGTRRYCIKTDKPILKLFRPSGSPIILVSSDPCADTQFQAEPLQRGR